MTPKEHEGDDGSHLFASIFGTCAPIKTKRLKKTWWIVHPPQTLNLWYVYLHLANFHGKFSSIYHTWIQRDMMGFKKRCFLLFQGDVFFEVPSLKLSDFISGRWGWIFPGLEKNGWWNANNLRFKPWNSQITMSGITATFRSPKNWVENKCGLSIHFDNGDSDLMLKRMVILRDFPLPF